MAPFSGPLGISSVCFLPWTCRPHSDTLMNAPVTRHKTPHYLLRELLSRSESSALRGLSPDLLSLLITPPASLARWIHSFHPELCEKPALHIVLMGVANQDGVDSGRWYSLLPWLLGNESLKVRITLVGHELFGEGEEPRQASRKATLTSPANARVANLLPPARLVPGGIADFLAGPTGQEPVDLFFAFNPGFSEEESWFNPGNLEMVCRRGVPIGATSFCEHDRVDDVETLETEGYTVMPQREENPLCGGQTEMGSWGSTFWEIGQGPPVDFVPDIQRKQRLEAYFERASDFVYAHGRTPLLDAGMVVPLQVPGEASPRRMIRLLTPFIGVDRETGQLFEMDEAGRLLNTLELKLPEPLMQRYPDGPFGFEHLHWTHEAQEAAETLSSDFEEPGMLESVLRLATEAAGNRQRNAPAGSEEAEDDRLFPMSKEDMMKGVADLLKLSTVKDLDPESFMNGMRAAGGIHGPTHDAWWNLFSHLEWDLEELTDEPDRLEPAFVAHSASGVSLPVICEAYGYLPGDDQDELAEEAKEVIAQEFPEGAVLVFKVMPLKVVGDHHYAFGGLLYLRQQWRPFALCDSMRGLDALLEQREHGFSFNAPDPKYADDKGLAQGLALMTHGRDPNTASRMFCIKQGDWLMPVPD